MASYTKLRSGEWGVRSTTPIEAGQVVSVTKKSGETKTETISKVLWSGNGVWLASIGARSDSRSGRRTSGRYGGCRECGGPLRDAPRHPAMGGLCGECAFDEYDC